MDTDIIVNPRVSPVVIYSRRLRRRNVFFSLVPQVSPAAMHSRRLRRRKIYAATEIGVISLIPLMFINRRTLSVVMFVLKQNHEFHLQLRTADASSIVKHMLQMRLFYFFINKFGLLQYEFTDQR